MGTIEEAKARGLFVAPDGTIPGSIVQVWKPEWGCYHFGIADWNEQFGSVVISEEWSWSPGKIIEMKIGDGPWERAPMHDYKFIKRVWEIDESTKVQMRKIGS